ncbi:uncharacterized protein LOC117320354 [Pecten maximus]|uniref:uncharacterized protein LOC117320354 n=1 Tax=Pecten maximus TaxID=6579 RepID=UPI001458A891|nr:uncharacterized protein LOC117320354 [Pecten maximus]
MIGDRSCRYLVDSGSVVTIVTDDFYFSLPESQRPELKSSNILLYSASGDTLKVAGKARFSFKVGKVVYKHEAIVAHLDQLSGIIGVDFLSEHGGVLDFVDNALKLEGQRVNLAVDGYNECAHVRLSEAVSIPASSEVHIRGYLDRPVATPEGLVEPSKFLANQGLSMARTLVATEGKETCFSVLNLGRQDIRLHQNTVIGEFQGVVKVCEVSDSCSEHSELPPHLVPLIDKLSPELSGVEKQDVTELVIEFQDIFLSPHGGFGQTDLIEHTIDTCDQAPIKFLPGVFRQHRRKSWSLN